MSKRSYTHIQRILLEIKEIIANRKSHREIEAFFGPTGDRPVHNLLKRERRKAKKALAGIAPRPKGCPLKDVPSGDRVAEGINRLMIGTICCGISCN